MEINELYYKLTGTKNPRYLTKDQKLVIDDCLKIINEIEQSNKDYINNIASIELIKIRNHFVTTLPTGDVTAWDMICWAKNFSGYMDKIIQEAENHVCVDGKEHDWTTAPDNLTDVFCIKCYNNAPKLANHERI